MKKVSPVFWKQPAYGLSARGCAIESMMRLSLLKGSYPFFFSQYCTILFNCPIYHVSFDDQFCHSSATMKTLLQIYQQSFFAVT